MSTRAIHRQSVRRPVVGRRLVTAVAAAAVLAPIGIASGQAASATTGTVPTGMHAAAATQAATPFAVSSSSAESDIKALQYLLRAYGIDTQVDGSYGPGTTKSVKVFQSRRKMSQDGSAGPATMAALTGGSNVRVTAGWKNANTVKAAEVLLLKVGYGPWLDSAFDAADVNRVKDFQKKHKLSVTGAVDANTWKALFAASAPTRRTGPVVLLPQYASGLTAAEQLHGCGPAAMVVTQLRLGKHPVGWSDAEHGAAAIRYARKTTLRMASTSTGTSQIGDATGVLAGWKRAGISGAARGTTTGATAAVRSGGVAMVLGKLSVARTWQHASGGGGDFHWITLVDYNAANGTYEVSDSSHHSNKLVWVTKAQLDSFAVTSESSSVYTG